MRECINSPREGMHGWLIDAIANRSRDLAVLNSCESPIGEAGIREKEDDMVETGSRNGVQPHVGRIGRRQLIGGAVAASTMASFGMPAHRTVLARQADEPTRVLQLGGESEPAGSWLPFRAAGGAETQVFDLIFSRLIRFDADYTLIPDLAERFEISPDASEFTFFLRQDVTWHDGQPFTARDVIFTYRLAMMEEVAASQYNKLSQVQGAEAFRAGESDEIPGLQMVDDYTVKIVLEQPNIAFLIGAAHNNSLVWILPEHVLE